MTFDNVCYDVCVNLVAGVLGILIVLWLERQRRPSLTLRIGQRNILPPMHRSGLAPGTWLYVEVRNRNVPRWLRWCWDGEPALSCRAWIGFYDLSGGSLFSREMIGRWAASAEPWKVPVTTQSGSGVRLVDLQDTYDIPPGGKAELDTVYRGPKDVDCYGWSNESYLHGRTSRLWKVPKGRHLARVRVSTAGRESVDTFLIVNEGPYSEFRLEPADDEMKKCLETE